MTPPETLIGLVRTEITAFVDAPGPPADLADRAVAAGAQRVRGRCAVAGGALAAAAAVALVTVRLMTVAGSSAPPATEATPTTTIAARNVVFATVTDDGGVTVLNPATGKYRVADVGVVMNGSADLRLASAVPRQLADSPPGDKRIGTYDTVTGETRWFDAPQRWSTPPTISPDGRYLAAPYINPAPTPANGLIIVDTRDGSATAVGVSAEVAAANDVFVGNADLGRTPPTLRPRGYFDPVLRWLPDSRHVLIGNAVVDLTGRQTATLPIRSAWLVAPREDGAGLLVVPKDALNTYLLTDAAGTTVERGRLCGDDLPAACPRLYFDSFLGWRGDRHIVIRSPDGGGGLDAVDLRTGKRERVGAYDATRVVVEPAHGLSPAVRDTASF